MPKVIRFTSETVADVAVQAVYWKDRWHSAWTRVPELWCREAVWCLGPSLSTAQLVYRYGDTLEIGARQVARRVPLNRTRW